MYIFVNKKAEVVNCRLGFFYILFFVLRGSFFESKAVRRFIDLEDFMFMHSRTRKNDTYIKFTPFFLKKKFAIMITTNREHLGNNGRRILMKKRLSAILLSLAMTLSFTACSENGNSGGNSAPDNTGGNSAPADSGGESATYKKQDKIVVWTLAADLKQFAERYQQETGNEVEVVVYDSADFETKIMQTLGTGSKDIDVFVGEPQMLPNFYEAGFCADLSEFDSEVSSRLVDYTYQAGKDENGVLRAVTFQSCPGSVIYRRDLATEVFGTDDPDEIGKKFASFSEIEKTAEAMNEKGYRIFGDTGALRWFSNSSNPWVKDGKIIVDQDRLDYFDTAVNRYQKNQVAFANEWSVPWYASMAGPLPIIGADADVWGMDKDQLINDAANDSANTTQVFSYVMPSWGALIVRDNAANNKGKFGLCSGVCGFFGGGSFLMVNEFSKNKEAAAQFVRYCTLDDDTARWWIDAANGDMIANKAVIAENANYENPSFGNQKTYAFFTKELDKIDYGLITGYDDACKDAFGKAIISVQQGKQTKQEALKEFYDVIVNTYPELSIPDDAPIN